ncbi:efflux RND transporter periplasmic adaptor subunit [Burkholderia ambifaria]|uniref:efflux RND transporter periplasmic adaptor subunit n=1 Tax=Burkholderia ambifaria TaxID=152480 RepID=UPI001E292ED1|nr:biotin/lipoyl-binding protein [Burkholderia ambifaria]
MPHTCRCARPFPGRPSFPGRLEAFASAPIHARVPGHPSAWYVDIGASVKAGQLLAVIDAPELDQQLRQAKADLRNAVANEKLAEKTARLRGNMPKLDSASRHEADWISADLAIKRATSAATEANVRRIEAPASFKRITAPFDGIVTARRIDVGALIDTGTNGGRELVGRAGQIPIVQFICVYRHNFWHVLMLWPLHRQPPKRNRRI